MISKTIKYEDLDGNSVEEEFYFHLSKADLTELAVTDGDTLEDLLLTMAKTESKRELFAIFKKILVGSVGKRSEDGKRFIKNDELRSAFADSEAYGELFVELVQDENAAAAFINGLMPASMAKAAEKDGPRPKISYKDLQAMSTDDLKAVLEKARKGELQ